MTWLFSGSSHETLGLLILILPFTQTVHQKAIVVSIVQNHIVMLHVPLQFESSPFVLPTNYQVSGFFFKWCTINIGVCAWILSKISS